MVKKALKRQIQPVFGKCCECKHSYDYHELTAYEPRVPFLCKCRLPDDDGKHWSKFLDHPCENGKFEKRTV